MNVLCLSASNIEPAKEHSASTRTCELIRETILERQPKGTKVDIECLIDAKLKPCRMCGKCLEDFKCSHDRDFNDLFAKLQAADRIFIVSPQYAVIPAKLVIMLEKFQEMAYLNYTNQTGYAFPLAGKPVGLIAHGGQTEEAVPIYKQIVLAPLASALSAVGLKVVGLDDDSPHGVAFGMTRLFKPEDSIFVTIEHDWGAIRARVEPLVEKVLAV